GEEQEEQGHGWSEIGGRLQDARARRDVPEGGGWGGSRRLLRECQRVACGAGCERGPYRQLNARDAGGESLGQCFSDLAGDEVGPAADDLEGRGRLPAYD